VLVSALALGVVQVACAGSDDDTSEAQEEDELERTFDPAPAGPSWAPRPQDIGGLSAVATVDGDRFLLHTEHGDVDFLPGINMGSTVPGRQPGEVAITAEDVRRWLPLMGEMGFRVLRIYTILPPEFYEELAAYNTENEDAPIYLVQGVYLPDESYVESRNLYDPAVTTAFSEEIDDAVAAVHGELEREPQLGRASGEWTADVSPWLAAWIIGAELEPEAIEESDATNADAPTHAGEYFVNTEEATPTTRWLAARMEETAAADAERGHAAPVAFVNWSTLDPLTHPEEPLDLEDLVGVDANTIAPTEAWPAGTFASYHAYPYYPDFLRYEPGLQVEYEGRVDPYAAYLADLKEHHAGMPVLITEFGVPSSLGSAHIGALGRDQGGHSEQDAMEIDAEMLRMMHGIGLDGAFLFSWKDEWFKLTWNTQPRQIPPDRRQLWHDALTNEQYFGVVATDPDGPVDEVPRVIAEEDEAVLVVDIDESWVHLELELGEEPDEPVTLAFDVVDGGADQLPGPIDSDGTADYAVVVEPGAEEAQAWVRAELDPVQYDGMPPPDPRPPPVDGWMPQQLSLNRARVIPSTGQEEPAEFFDVGVLRSGEMEPGEDGYDSRNTWRLDGSTLTMRIPWGLIGMADPSSKQALVPDAEGRPSATDVDTIGLTVDLGDEQIDTAGITWEPWQSTNHTERVKEGVQAYVDAQYDVTPR
jgi:hypothetical protein